MLRNRREENYSLKAAHEVIADLEKIVRNLQMQCRSANNEIVKLKRENTRAVRDKIDANNTLNTIRNYKLTYLEHLLAISKLTENMKFLQSTD